MAWDLLAAECVQGNKDGAEITLEGSVPTRNAFAQKLKDPPRFQCIYLPPTAADVTPLVGNLPIPEAGIMDSGASCTIVNNMESIPDARLLPKRIPVWTSGRVIVFATHYGTCDVVIVNTADGYADSMALVRPVWSIQLQHVYPGRWWLCHQGAEADA